MNTHKLYILFLALVVALGACRGDDDVDRSVSVFDSEAPQRNVYEQWITDNYTTPYNIEVFYRLEDRELDFTRFHAPVKLDKSMKLTKIVKHAWLDAYAQIAGVDFVRRMAPRIMMLVGSPSYNSDGTITLGTAEGGLKVTFYQTNWLNERNTVDLNQYFLHMVHHEFTHILHASKAWPQEFNLISQGDYAPTAWHNRNALESYNLGFITPYAGSQIGEDITEVTAKYLTLSPENYARIKTLASAEGWAKIERKVNIMKKYMLEAWGIDMDVLRAEVQRRTEEVRYLPLIEPSWEALLSASGAEERSIDLARAEIARALLERQPELFDTSAATHKRRCDNCSALLQLYPQASATPLVGVQMPQ